MGETKHEINVFALDVMALLDVALRLDEVAERLLDEVAERIVTDRSHLEYPVALDQAVMMSRTRLLEIAGRNSGFLGPAQERQLQRLRLRAAMVGPAPAKAEAGQ